MNVNENLNSRRPGVQSIPGESTELLPTVLKEEIEHDDHVEVLTDTLG